MEKMLSEIELLRHAMEKLGSVKGVNDPDVIASSQKLDKALNKYYRLRQARGLLTATNYGRLLFLSRT